jgi:hypothetical protein
MGQMMKKGKKLRKMSIEAQTRTQIEQSGGCQFDSRGLSGRCLPSMFSSGRSQ